MAQQRVGLTDLYGNEFFTNDISQTIQEWEEKVGRYPHPEPLDDEDTRREAGVFYAFERANARFVLNQLFRLSGYPYRIIGEIEFRPAPLATVIQAVILLVEDDETLLVRYWQGERYIIERIATNAVEVLWATYQTPLARQTRLAAAFTRTTRFLRAITKPAVESMARG